jgi:hypothetical protein
MMLDSPGTYQKPLVEILVVIVILGVLATIVATSAR